MQLLPFIFTQLPQLVLNFTNPTSSLSSSSPQVTGTAAMAYTLPALPYAYDALEPYISKEVMTLHHTKHHQAYVNALNALTVSYTHAVNIKEQIALQQGIKFNGGGHINHSLFWANLAPASSSSAKTSAAPKLMKALENKYGSYDNFRSQFSAALSMIQGSGWGWLVRKVDGELDIVTTKDQDPVVGAQVVLGIDMWEHAYYLQYLNNKADYLRGIWQIINWEECEKRFVEYDLARML